MQCWLVIVLCLGKKEVQNFREQLLEAKREAEAIAVITPELEKEFLEVRLSHFT